MGGAHRYQEDEFRRGRFTKVGKEEVESSDGSLGLKRPHLPVNYLDVVRNLSNSDGELKERWVESKKEAPSL